MGSSQQFSLRWNNYLKYITDAFDTLRTHEDLVDVTLSCEGKRIRAHKMLLSACSTYLRDLFKENPCQHPVIIFRNVKFDDLAALVKFMYQGEVNVVQEQLASFLTTAELLEVKGLTQDTAHSNEMVIEDDVDLPNEPEVQLQNLGGTIAINSKGGLSPSSPLSYHTVDVRSDTPPTKKRKCRDNSSSSSEKSNNAASKDKDTTTNSEKSGADPVEIIPLMPKLKMEMSEYLEQDGSSCSYDDQNLSESLRIKAEGNASETTDNENKPDISQTFYSGQSSDIESKFELGHMLSKPSTSGERAQDAAQDFRTVVVEHPSHSCRLCGKSFWNRDSMYKHMNMHKGTTQCPVCQKILSRTTHMKRHLKNRHGWQPPGDNTRSSAPTWPAQRQTTGNGNTESNAISGCQPSPTFTTIRIRESSVERITSSPIP